LTTKHTAQNEAHCKHRISSTVEARYVYACCKLYCTYKNIQGELAIMPSFGVMSRNRKWQLHIPFC